MHPEFNKSDHIRVRLENCVTQARCGLHPWERHEERPHRLRIDIDLFARLYPGPTANQGYIDYDRLRNYLKTFPTRPHTDLLETLLDDITSECFLDPRVEACRVSVLKLDVFNEIGAAGVEAFRTRASWSGAA